LTQGDPGHPPAFDTPRLVLEEAEERRGCGAVVIRRQLCDFGVLTQQQQQLC